MQRTEGLTLCRLRGDENSAFALLGPAGCAPRPAARLLFGGEHAEAVGDQAEGGQDAGSLLLRTLGDDLLELRSLHAPINLVRVGHPLDQLLRRGSEGQQVGEELLGEFREELALPIVGRLVEGGGDGLGLRLPANLLGWTQ